MSLRLALAAVAALACATPALAQDAAQPADAAAAQPTAEELAIEAAAQAFDARMQTMGAELQAVMADATTTSAQKTASVETILATYTPEINAFADQVVGFLNARAAESTDPAEQAAIAQAAQGADQGIRSIPDQVRASIQAALTAAESAAASGAGADGSLPVVVAGEVPTE